MVATRIYLIEAALVASLSRSLLESVHEEMTPCAWRACYCFL